MGASALREPPPRRVCTTPAVGGAAAAKNRNRAAAEDHIRSIRANRVVAAKDLIRSNRLAAEDLRQGAAKDIIQGIRANREAAAEDPIQSSRVAAEEVIPCILRAANQAAARIIHATVEGLIRSIQRRNTAQASQAHAAGVRVTAGAEPAVGEVLRDNTIGVGSDIRQVQSVSTGIEWPDRAIASELRGHKY